MAYQAKAFSQVDPKALASWVGTFLRDTTLGDIGIVQAVDAESEPASLKVAFPGDTEFRSIAIEPLTDSLEYVCLDDVRGRYRRPTPSELQAARDEAARKRA